MTRGRWMVKRALVLNYQIYFRLSNSLALTLLAQILFICEALEILIIRDLNKKKLKKGMFRDNFYEVCKGSVITLLFLRLLS